MLNEFKINDENGVTSETLEETERSKKQKNRFSIENLIKDF